MTANGEGPCRLDRVSRQGSEPAACPQPAASPLL